MERLSLSFLCGFLLSCGICLCNPVDGTLEAESLTDSAFPKPSEFEFNFYSTEVVITDVLQEVTVNATEYRDNDGKAGAVKISFEGDMRSVYYNYSSYQITSVVDYNCTVTSVDISDFRYNRIYHGWLNRDPLVIGPSAALWYAETRYKEIKYVGIEVVRDIKCNHFQLPVKNKMDNLTMDFYFALDNWVTPYIYEDPKKGKLKIPVRIRVSGKSSRYLADPSLFVDVDQINDFAYFKPTIGDFNNLMPPLGLGCINSKKAEDFPKIPKSYCYSAEVVDLLSPDKVDDVEIQYQRTYYDYIQRLARKDEYTRKEGNTSNLYDFNTGVYYKTLDDGTCQIHTLRNTEFQSTNNGFTSRMKSPEEALNLDGDFYPMGKREIRGLSYDVYEKVISADDGIEEHQDELYFMGEKFYKLVTTVYFIDGLISVGVYGEVESRIPAYYIITGYSKPSNRTLQLQYNISGFNDVIWPEMYTTYGLDRCYSKPQDKSNFVLVMKVDDKTARAMEGQDEVIMMALKSVIAKHAKVLEMRIPYLKADYKTTEVFVTGIMLERPPAFKQFYYFDDDEHMMTNDEFLKIDPANTEEKCALACVDNDDYPCKGFYWCGQSCFLKSADPTEIDKEAPTQDLGKCTEYIRAEIDSTNFRQAYLSDALGNLKKAILDEKVKVIFKIPQGEGAVLIKEIIIGDRLYTGPP